MELASEIFYQFQKKMGRLPEIYGPDGGPKETKWTVELINAPKD